MYKEDTADDLEDIPLVENRVDDYGASKNIQNNATNHEDTPRNPVIQCLRGIKESIRHIVQQHERNKSYYTNKITEDLKVISSQCRFLIGVLQLLAGVAILVAYVFAELILARLVFKQTNTTDINSLLALLPTVIFSIFTWFGRGLIFDVREDLKELSIPYFRKKETTEEKLLQEMAAVKRELQQGIKIRPVESTTEANETAAEPTNTNNEDNRVTMTAEVHENINESNILRETPKLELAN